MISVCPANAQFIWIHPNQLQMPWVQELLIDLKCEVLRISEPKSEYFEEVLSYLLEEAFLIDVAILYALLNMLVVVVLTRVAEQRHRELKAKERED